MTESIDAAVPQVAEGMPVFSADGAALGEVAETRPAHFQVDAKGRGSFWLQRDWITKLAPKRVDMSFLEADLKEHQLSDPGAAGVVPATSQQPAYIAGATPAEANVLFDPKEAGKVSAA